MADGKRFDINITSTDNSEAGFKSAAKRADAIGKGPINKLNKQMDDLWSSKGLKSFAKGLDLGGNIGGRSLSEMVGGFAQAAKGASLLEGSVGALSLGLGAVVGAAVAAGTAMYAFSKPWINTAANIGNLSRTLGIATKDLQNFENAGAQFGVDKGAMDSSIAGIGAFAHAVKFDPSANLQRALVDKLKLNIKYDAAGNADIPDLMYQFADATANQKNAYGAQHLAQIGGFSAALPAFQRGSANFRAAASMSDSIAGTYSPADIAASMNARQFDVLNQQGLQHMVHIGQRAAAQPVAAVEHASAQAMQTLFTETPKMVQGFGVAATDLQKAVMANFAPASEKLNASADSLMKFFESKGWSAAQSAAIVGNDFGENNTFDPKRWQGGSNGQHGPAYGIAQWEGPRQRDFEAWAGHPITQSTLAEQAAFENYELTQGSRRRAGSMLKGAGNVDDASAIVTKYYESPADIAGQTRIRQGYAESALAGRLDITVHLKDDRVVVKTKHKNGVHQMMVHSN